MLVPCRALRISTIPKWMGRLDQYAKEIFARRPRWSPTAPPPGSRPARIGLTEIRLDGCILDVSDASLLAALPEPWPHARGRTRSPSRPRCRASTLDMRRRRSAPASAPPGAPGTAHGGGPKVPWDGDLPLWVLASHVPAGPPQAADREEVARAVITSRRARTSTSRSPRTSCRSARSCCLS